ncbi:hypothetical protein SNEBB_011059 [Seison nebaliae]|nr:hypothetical protein SNEBB_011059 [Seison nebaliae]
MYRLIRFTKTVSDETKARRLKLEEDCAKADCLTVAPKLTDYSQYISLSQFRRLVVELQLKLQKEFEISYQLLDKNDYSLFLRPNVIHAKNVNREITQNKIVEVNELCNKDEIKTPNIPMSTKFSRTHLSTISKNQPKLNEKRNGKITIGCYNQICAHKLTNINCTYKNISRRESMMKKNEGEFKKITRASKRFDLDDFQPLYKKSSISMELLGEICYQLDRRILQYIFNSSKITKQDYELNCLPLYGYSTKCIQWFIELCATNRVTNVINAQLLDDLKDRYCYLLSSLRHLGYEERRHGKFCEVMVNQFGLLSKKDRNLSFAELRQLVAVRAFPIYSRDMLIITDCLLLMATNDKRDVFLY